MSLPTNQELLDLWENTAAARFDGKDNGPVAEAEAMGAVLGAVIEALAAEAEGANLEIVTSWPYQEGDPVSDWLRAHLPAGRDGEAGT